MATESILKPGTPEARPPLKRNTIIGLLLLVLALLGLGAFVGQNSKRNGPPPTPEVKANQPIGSATAIDDEAAKAAPKVVPTTPMPIPVEAKRTDSSVAGVERAGKGERDSRTDLLAAGVMSRSVVMDAARPEFGGPDEAEPETTNRLALTRVAQQAAGAGPGAPSAPNASDADAPVNPDSYRNAALQAYRDAARAPSGNDHNVAWLKEYGQLKAAQSIKPKEVKGRYVLAQGMVIPAILQRNINSDLPGEVVAVTSSDVYDSFNGFHLVIPKGSRLVGDYSSGVRVGQERLMFAFSRLVLPNRVSFDLPAASGMDLSGASGMTGNVNNHYFKMLGTSLMVALLGATVEKGEPAPSGLGGSGGAKTAAGQVFVDVSRSVLDRNKSIVPTITVPAGTRINVQVVRDMEFPSAYTQGKQQ